MRARLVLAIVSTALEVTAAVAVSVLVLPRINIHVPIAAVAAIALAWIGWSAFTYHKGTQALLRRPLTGLTDMTGREGTVARALHPNGTVKIGGELWSARAVDGRRIDAGAVVVVMGKTGLTLIVRADGLGRGAAATENRRDNDHDQAGDSQ